MIPVTADAFPFMDNMLAESILRRRRFLLRHLAETACENSYRGNRVRGAIAFGNERGAFLKSKPFLHAANLRD